MKNKKEVLIIDNDLKFVSKIKENLENEVNIISVETPEEALKHCEPNRKVKDGEAKILPDLIIIGDGCKVSTALKEKLKKNFPDSYNEETLQTFLPLFYCKLFQDTFQPHTRMRPKVCICANLEQYPFKGNDQDITKKLGYCMQYGIPLMNRTPDNRKRMVTLLNDHIRKICGIEKNKGYR